MMQRYGTIGLWIWYVIGGWVGMSTYQLVEANSGVYARVSYYGENAREALLVSFLDFAVMTVVSVLFPAWNYWRIRRSGRPNELVWWIPFLFGLTLVPVFVLLLNAFMFLTGLGSGTIIGCFVMCVLFGLPVLAAEACIRLSNRRVDSQA